MLQDFGSAGESEIYSELIDNLITKISDVRFLHLSGCALVAFDIFWRPTRFPNLIHLELGVYNVSGWTMLPDILESSPNLEQLGFKEGVHRLSMNNEMFQHYVPETVPLCLSLHIKQIVIRKFLGKKDELEMVEYFLESPKVLKKMTIYSDLPSEEKLCLSQKLLMSLRFSEACQFVLT